MLCRRSLRLPSCSALIRLCPSPVPSSAESRWFVTVNDGTSTNYQSHWSTPCPQTPLIKLPCLLIVSFVEGGRGGSHHLHGRLWAPHSENPYLTSPRQYAEAAHPTDRCCPSAAIRPNTHTTQSSEARRRQFNQIRQCS